MRLKVAGLQMLSTRIWLSLALGALLLTGTAWAQATSSSSVTGQVTDQQKAAIPGAAVKLVDATTGASQTATTNDTGRYVFANVTPGAYTITITKTDRKSTRLNSSHRCI